MFKTSLYRAVYIIFCSNRLKKSGFFFYTFFFNTRYSVRYCPIQYTFIVRIYLKQSYYLLRRTKSFLYTVVLRKTRRYEIENEKNNILLKRSRV